MLFFTICARALTILNRWLSHDLNCDFDQLISFLNDMEKYNKKLTNCNSSKDI